MEIKTMARTIKVQGFITRNMEVQVSEEVTAEELCIRFRKRTADVALFELQCDGKRVVMKFKNTPKFQMSIGDCFCIVWEKIKEGTSKEAQA